MNYRCPTHCDARHATYSYDSAGQRTRSVVVDAGGTTTTDFTYTGLALQSLSATWTDGGTPETTESWKLTYLYDEYGRPYGGIYRDTTDSNPANWPDPVFFGILTTDRGDVIALLDKNGSPFAAYRYDAWANPLGAGTEGTTGIWWQATTQGENEVVSLELAETIALRQPLRYASYCYDAESGMYYLSARHYDPATRQFLSKDLSRNDGEQSAYQYCLGNPVGNVDPTGFAVLREDAKQRSQIERLRHTKKAWRWMQYYAKNGYLDDGVYNTTGMDLVHPVTITRGLMNPGSFTKFVGQAVMRGSLFANGDGAARAAQSCVVVKDGRVYEPLDNVSIYAGLTGVNAGRDTQLTTRRRDPGDGGVFLAEDLTDSARLASLGYESAAYASETAQAAASLATKELVKRLLPTEVFTHDALASSAGTAVQMALDQYAGDTTQWALGMADTPDFANGQGWFLEIPSR